MTAERPGDGDQDAVITREPSWTRPPARGRGATLATAVVAVAIVGLLLVPVPDGPRRVAVLVLLGVLVAVQVVLWARGWRWYRPLTPKALRMTHMISWFWGAFIGAISALPLVGGESALSAVVSGSITTALWGTVMWFLDPGRPGPGQ